MIRTHQVDRYCWKPRVVHHFKLDVDVDLLKYYVIGVRRSWSRDHDPFFRPTYNPRGFFFAFNPQGRRSNIGSDLNVVRKLDDGDFVVVFVTWSIGDATTPYVRILPSFFSLFECMHFHFYSSISWIRLQWTLRELLGVPRISQLSMAQWKRDGSGERFGTTWGAKNFYALKGSTNCGNRRVLSPFLSSFEETLSLYFFLHPAHHILHLKYLAGRKASTGECLGRLCG